jgi:Ankyrin repeats (many copies)
VHLACLLDNNGSMREHVRLLVGAWPKSLSERDAYQQLPLHVAFGQHYPSLAVVRGLVEAYPEALEKANILGMLPLHLAVRSLARMGQPSPSPATRIHMARYLMGRWPQALHVQAAVGTPLCVAISFHASVELVRFLVRQSPESVRSPSRTSGLLPLHVAAQFGTVEVARSVWEQWPESIQVAATNAQGWLPIHVAAKFVDVEVARFLVEQRPDHLREGRTHEGRLPIHEAAVGQGALDLVRFFAEMAPETVRATTRDGELPIHLAARKGDLDVVRLLLRIRPQSVRETTIDGHLPLH